MSDFLLFSSSVLYKTTTVLRMEKHSATVSVLDGHISLKTADRAAFTSATQQQKKQRGNDDDDDMKNKKVEGGKQKLPAVETA
ncbi:uncharacterized protein V6R79_003054 [Siganus canaliculatus]